MGTLVGIIAVIGQVHHLYPVATFCPVSWQQSGIEQVFIISMGRKQHQIRTAIQRRRPPLDRIRKLSGGVCLDLA